MKEAAARPRVPFPRAEMLAALATEREHRDFAFLELPFLVCGLVPIRQLSLQQLLTRLNIDCPFFSGRQPTAEDVAEFLWYLSPEFVPTGCPEAFIKTVATLDYFDAVADIYRYIDLIFFDCPNEKAKTKAPIASMAATLIHVFASEYGWSRGNILDSPIPQLFQLLREIELSHKGKDAILINRLSDKVKADWGKELNAEPNESEATE